MGIPLFHLLIRIQNDLGSILQKPKFLNFAKFKTVILKADLY